MAALKTFFPVWHRFGSTVWVYPNQTYSDNLADFANKYVYSFYWSALTLLALGKPFL